MVLVDVQNELRNADNALIHGPGPELERLGVLFEDGIHGPVSPVKQLLQSSERPALETKVVEVDVQDRGHGCSDHERGSTPATPRCMYCPAPP